MKIVHVITRFVRGGADENTLFSCNAQAASGHEVHLIHGAEWHPGMAASLNPAVIRHRVSPLVRPMRPLEDLRAYLELRGLFRALSPDIIHTHTSKAGALGRAAAIGSGAAVIHGVHILPFLHVSRLEKYIYLAVEKLLAPFTDAFVNVSEGMQTAGLAHGLGRPSNHYVVASGMNLEAFKRAEPVGNSELAGLLAIPEAEAAEARVVLMVAALEPRKRQFEFLEIFRDVAISRPNLFLILAGEGLDRGRIEARAVELGIADRVAFAGFRTDVERWIARADLCVLASEREGLPRAVVQYVLGGRAVLTTDLPGIDAVVKDGRNGRVVDLQLKGMESAMGALLDSPATLSEMRRASADLELSAWGIDAMTDALEEIYRHVSTERAAKTTERKLAREAH